MYKEMGDWGFVKFTGFEGSLVGSNQVGVIPEANATGLFPLAQSLPFVSSRPRKPKSLSSAGQLWFAYNQC